jgi:hypothetical protein
LFEYCVAVVRFVVGVSFGGRRRTVTNRQVATWTKNEKQTNKYKQYVHANLYPIVL